MAWRAVAGAAAATAAAAAPGHARGVETRAGKAGVRGRRARPASPARAASPQGRRAAAPLGRRTASAAGGKRGKAPLAGGKDVTPSATRPPSKTVFTVPTLLTIARVFAIPFVAAAYCARGDGGGAFAPAWWSATLYSLACFTDWLDGYIARRYGSSSRFGAFLDPVSDKLMVATVLILLCASPPAILSGSPPSFAIAAFLASLSGLAWVVPLSACVIISREIAMSALREWAAELGPRARDRVNVNSLGKWKTATQMVSLGMLLAARDGAAWASEGMAGGQAGAWVCGALGPPLLLVSAYLTFHSFTVYFVNLWPVMTE